MGQFDDFLAALKAAHERIQSTHPTLATAAADLGEAHTMFHTTSHGSHNPTAPQTTQALRQAQKEITQAHNLLTQTETLIQQYLAFLAGQTPDTGSSANPQEGNTSTKAIDDDTERASRHVDLYSSTGLISGKDFNNPDNFADGEHYTLQDGSWIGKENGQTLYLTPRANDAVNKFIEKALRSEPFITCDVQSVTDSIKHGIPNARLIGPDTGHQLKSDFSLKRKIAEVLAKRTSLDPYDAVRNIKDAVRYTIELPLDRYIHGAQSAMKTLRMWGFRGVAFKNYWNIHDGISDYKGINTAWRDPRSGQEFEIQFHTPDSLEAKELAHPYYEALRLSGTSELERQEAATKTEEIYGKVAKPPGAERVKGW